MAAPADVNVRLTGANGSDLQQLVTQLNLLTVSYRVLTAKLDADAGVTDTTYGALCSDIASAKLAGIV